jgi:hypothetical protein
MPEAIPNVPKKINLIHVRKGDSTVTIEDTDLATWTDLGYAPVTDKAQLKAIDKERAASVAAAAVPVVPKDPLEVKIEAIARAVAKEEIAAAVAAAAASKPTA